MFSRSSFRLLGSTYVVEHSFLENFSLFSMIIESTGFTLSPLAPTFLSSLQAHPTLSEQQIVLFLKIWYQDAFWHPSILPTLDALTILMSLIAVYGPLIYSHLYVSNMNHSSESPIYSTVYLTHLTQRCLKFSMYKTEFLLLFPLSNVDPLSIN